MAPTKRKQPPPTSDTLRRSTRLSTTAPPPPPVAAAEPKKKKPKKTVTVEAKPVVSTNGPGKTIVIEHCKQCNAFKTRALLVKQGLEKGVVGGVNVVVNAEKPRRGCFEVREESGEVFVSLLDLKRPFQKMKDLDMEQVVAEIVEKLNSTK